MYNKRKESESSRCLTPNICRLSAQCKEPYATHWKHSKRHCPNLVPDDLDRKGYGELKNASEIPVHVIFDKNQVFYWRSLVHLWANWYHYYLRMATYPRLLVRFEDMLLHAPAILKKVAECAGTTVPEQFTFQTASSKSHGSGTTFLKAITKTGNEPIRVEGMTKEDLEYAKQQLDPELMRLFQYRHPGEYFAEPL